MRPGRLREIFDDAGNTVVAFDQEHVALLDDPAQILGIAGRERLIARHFLLKVAGDQLANGVEGDAHDLSSPRPSWPFFFAYHRRKALQFSSWIAHINHD